MAIVGFSRVGIANCGLSCHFAASVQALHALHIQESLPKNEVGAFLVKTLEELSQATTVRPREWTQRKVRTAIQLKLLENEAGIQADPVDFITNVFQSICSDSTVGFDRYREEKVRSNKINCFRVNRTSQDPNFITSLFDSKSSDHFLKSSTLKAPDFFGLFIRSQKIRGDLNTPSTVVLQGNAPSDAERYSLKSVILFEPAEPQNHVVAHYMSAVPTCLPDGTVQSWRLYNDSSVRDLSNQEFTRDYAAKVDAVFYARCPQRSSCDIEKFYTLCRISIISFFAALYSKICEIVLNVSAAFLRCRSSSH
jgi:hypothetical protein